MLRRGFRLLLLGLIIKFGLGMRTVLITAVIMAIVGTLLRNV